MCDKMIKVNIIFFYFAASDVQGDLTEIYSDHFTQRITDRCPYYNKSKKDVKRERAAVPLLLHYVIMISSPIMVLYYYCIIMTSCRRRVPEADGRGLAHQVGKLWIDNER